MSGVLSVMVLVKSSPLRKHEVQWRILNHKEFYYIVWCLSSELLSVLAVLWIRGQTDSGSLMRIKEFKYFINQKMFISSRKYDTGCSSRIRILISYPSRIPDPGVIKALDPRSRSATLFLDYEISRTLVVQKPRGFANWPL